MRVNILYISYTQFESSYNRKVLSLISEIKIKRSGEMKKSFIKYLKRSLPSLLLAGALIGQLLPIHSFAASSTAAHWKFNKEQIKAGTSIANGNLIVKDTSGNGNDLRMNLYEDRQITQNTSGYKWEDYISFSQDSATESGKGSLKFDGDNENFIGADLVTVDSAPINKDEFRNGYTIEFLYQLPLDWTNSDQWMGLMARQTSPNGMPRTMDEPQLGSMSIAISNCKEVQFQTSNADDSHKMENSAWAVTMDKGGVWYHIAIVSDGEKIRTFVNGAESFRDYVSPEMEGLFADPSDGRFRVGSSYWLEGEQTLDKFLQGNIEEIRISEGALPKEEWLVQNPEIFAGNYGINESYSLKNPSNYNFVFIPDTQNTIKFKTEVMGKAVEEMLAQKDSANIKGVVHLGDVIEDQVDETQFNNAEAIFNKLPQGGMNLLMQPGNHDDPTVYNQYFGPNSKTYGPLAKNYATMDSPSGRSSYMIVEAGSYEYLILNLSYHDGATDFEWMKNVLENNKDKPTIISSHDIVGVSDTIPNETSLSEKGNSIWNLAKQYDQVFMMYGGHHHGAGYSTLTNDNGKIVYGVLADYQFGYNGGNGLFKYAQFSEADNKIYLETYSPYAASLKPEEKTFFDVNFLTGPGNDDVLALDFKTRFEGMEKSGHIEGHWAEDVIKDVLDKGYMDLDKPDIFSPDRSITRYEVVKAIGKLEKVNPKQYKNKAFTDLQDGTDENGYVSWAKENKIIHGYEDGSFKGDKLITREEMAKILNEYVENLDKNMPLTDVIIFKDEGKISDWAKEYVKKATQRDLIKGDDLGNFNPKKTLSKAETAQIIYNIYK